MARVILSQIGQTAIEDIPPVKERRDLLTSERNELHFFTRRIKEKNEGRFAYTRQNTGVLLHLDCFQIAFYIPVSSNQTSEY